MIDTFIKQIENLLSMEISYLLFGFCRKDKIKKFNVSLNWQQALRHDLFQILGFSDLRNYKLKRVFLGYILVQDIILYKLLNNFI